ncbi:MAG: hypothetical protein GVX96_04460 [Bacteroidetes bacterium]|jgi:hypothetical protein|nr:hypothetical protein [Bacteroidota bacterium]
MNRELREKGWKDMNQRLEASMPRDRNNRVIIWWFLGVAAFITPMVFWIFEEQNKDALQKEIVVESKQEIQNPRTSHKIEQNIENTSEFEESPATFLSTEQKTWARKGEPKPTIQPSAIEGGDNSKTGILVDKATQSGSPLELSEESGRLSDYTFVRELAGLAPQLFPLKDRLSLKEYIVPELNKVHNINPSKKKVNTSYFIEISSGIRTASPVSFIGQTGGGMRFSLSNKWDFMMSLGAGIEGHHENAEVDLKKRRSNDELASEITNEGQFTSGNSYGRVQIDLKNGVFAYSGFYVTRHIDSRWACRFGVEVAYRFYNYYEARNQFNFGTGDPTVNNQILRLSALEEEFVIFNRWDIRPIVGIEYDLHPDVNLALSYRHGLAPLLAYPAGKTPQIDGRFIQLGVQYQF